MKKEKTHEQIIDNLKDACVEALKENTKQMLESFKKLKPEQQLQEFAQGRVAESCMDNIVRVIQGLSDEERIEACDKFDFLKEILLHSVAYLELGTHFGYAETKEK